MPSNDQHLKLDMPFALFMGPQRAGTSWIHRYFKSRSDVCLPEDVKELFFFDFNFEQGKEFYFAHYKPNSDSKLAMEVSATYFANPDVPKRILEYFGSDIKLVCPLRHPVIRSYSLYKHFLRYGFVQGNLVDACKEKPEILITSHYASHLKNWIDVFGRDSIYFCFQEDLAKNQNSYVAGICSHLEISFMPIDEAISGYHNAATKPPIQILANIAQIIAQKLRKLKLYWVINFAKSIGLKALIFGAEQANSSSMQIPEEDRSYLEGQLDHQIQELEDLLGYRIRQWDDLK